MSRQRISPPVHHEDRCHRRGCGACVAQRLDRQWFKQNRGDVVRHRDAVAGEFAYDTRLAEAVAIPPVVGAQLAVEVTRMGRGVRARRPYWVVSESVLN